MESLGRLYPSSTEAGFHSPPASLPPDNRFPSLRLLRHGLGGQRTLLAIMQGAGRPSRAHGLQQRGLWPLKPYTHLRRYSHDVAQLSLLKFSPAFGQIQAPAQRRITFFTDMMNTHRHLTVARLAQCPGVLSRHTYRMAALLGKSRVIHHPRRIWF